MAARDGGRGKGQRGKKEGAGGECKKRDGSRARNIYIYIYLMYTIIETHVNSCACFSARERETDYYYAIVIMHKKRPLFVGRRRLEKIRRNGRPSMKDEIPVRLSSHVIE